MSLIEAVKTANLPRVISLLRDDTTKLATEYDDAGRPSMALACLYGHMNMVRLFVQHDHNIINQRDKCKNRHARCVHYAAQGGMLDVLDFLFRAGSHPHDKDHDGNTVLLYAVVGGHVRVVEWLVREHDCSLTDVNHYHHSAIMQAAYGGHCEMINWLLCRGANIHDRDIMGITPLLSAVWANKPAAFYHLLDCGACVVDKTTPNDTALLIAASVGALEIVQHLYCKYDMDLTETNDHGSVLTRAIMGGHTHVVIWLAEHNVDVHQMVNGTTAFLVACSYGHYAIARLLVDRYKVNPHTSSVDNTTAVMMAAADAGDLSLLAWLIDSCNCDMTTTNTHGYTAFALSCWAGQTHVLKYLEHRGCSITDVTRTGMTGLMIAAGQHRIDTCRYLLERSSDINVNLIDMQDNEGYTALMMAAQSDDIDMVKILCEYGADRSLRTQSGHTVYDEADGIVYAWLVCTTGLDVLQLSVALRNRNQVLRLLGAGFNCCQSSTYIKMMHNLATTNYFSEPCPVIVDILRRAYRIWTPSRYMLYGPRHRTDVFTILLIRNRLKTCQIVSDLSMELWLHIIDMLGRG